MTIEFKIEPEFAVYGNETMWKRAEKEVLNQTGKSIEQFKREGCSVDCLAGTTGNDRANNERTVWVIIKQIN